MQLSVGQLRDIICEAGETTTRHRRSLQIIDETIAELVSALIEDYGAENVGHIDASRLYVKFDEPDVYVGDIASETFGIVNLLHDKAKIDQAHGRADLFFITAETEAEYELGATVGIARYPDGGAVNVSVWVKPIAHVKWHR